MIDLELTGVHMKRHHKIYITIAFLLAMLAMVALMMLQA